MMRMFVALALVFIGIVMPSQGFSHGEDKPGPHGGVIRMPGAFHTELVQDGRSAARIYLLDFDWRNPLTEGSTVAARLVRKSAETGMNCAAAEDRFVCTLPSDMSFAKGDVVVVDSNRSGNKGTPVRYSFPFKRSGGH